MKPYVIVHLTYTGYAELIISSKYYTYVGYIGYRIYICVYVCMYMYMCECICVNVYVYVCVCVCMCVCDAHCACVCVNLYA